MPEGNVNLKSEPTFDGLGIVPQMFSVLDRLKFTTPTPIQQKAILPAIEGKDLVGIAQTGTGKTLAFAIPMVQRLSQHKGKGLVLVPTRELAMQVEETFRKVEQPFGIRSTVVIGGASMHEQKQALRKNPQVIIATPGRLIDHIQQRTVVLFDVQILVLDEADRMLDMGFLPQIERIIKMVSKERQTMLFSATMPQAISHIAASYMKLPLHVEIAPSGTLVEKLTQELFIVRKEMKEALLKKVLDQYRGSVLIFTRTKIGAHRTARAITAMGHQATEIHSDRSLRERKEALQGFKTGRYRVLVATDIAARGIDVTGIELVVNYDLPEEAENYVHRIGRTSRAGHKGHAISFATPDQKTDVRSIECLIRTALPISAHPEMPAEDFVKPTRQSFAASGSRFASHSRRRRLGSFPRRNRR